MDDKAVGQACEWVCVCCVCVLVLFFLFTGDTNGLASAFVLCCTSSFSDQNQSHSYRRHSSRIDFFDNIIYIYINFPLSWTLDSRTMNIELK